MLTEVVFAGGTHLGEVAGFFTAATVGDAAGAATVALSAATGEGEGADVGEGMADAIAAVVVAGAIGGFAGSGPPVGSLPFMTKTAMLPRPSSVIIIAIAAVVTCLRR